MPENYFESREQRKRGHRKGERMSPKKTRGNNKVMRRKKRSLYSSSSNDGHALKQLGKIIIYADDGQSTYYKIEEEEGERASWRTRRRRSKYVYQYH